MPDNDNDLVEVKGIEVPEGLDLMFDVGQEPASVTPATGTEPQQPEAVPPPQAPSPPALPAWLADIPEGERAQVIASGLASLSPDQLVGMEPVRELLGQVQNLTAAQMQEQQRQQYQQQLVDSQVFQNAQLFEQRLEEALPDGSGIDVRAETQDYTRAIQQSYHNYLIGQVQAGVLDGLHYLGMDEKNLPPGMLNQINAAGNDYAKVIKGYMDGAASRGFELGRLKEREDSTGRSKADETALRSRIRNEVLGQLSKDGKLGIGQDDSGYFAQLQAESTPPSLSGSPVPISAELDDAEVLAALADPDAYDRLMNDPAKARAFNKAMAGEMARQ